MYVFLNKRNEHTPINQDRNVETRTGFKPHTCLDK